MSGPGTGTASAVTTTLPAAPTASSAVASRTSPRSLAAGASMAMCPDRGGQASAAVVVWPGGSLVTGFATGLAATSTTLLAGWNASDAMHLEILALKCNEIDQCRKRAEKRRDDEIVVISQAIISFATTTQLCFFLCS